MFFKNCFCIAEKISFLQLNISIYGIVFINNAFLNVFYKDRNKRGKFYEAA